MNTDNKNTKLNDTDKKLHISDVIGSNLQRELFLFLKSNYGKSFTPEYLHINNFKHYSLRQLKYNLTKLTKKEIGVDEEYVCIKDSGVVYSNGYYYR